MSEPLTDNEALLAARRLWRANPAIKNEFDDMPPARQALGIEFVQMLWACLHCPHEPEFIEIFMEWMDGVPP